MDKLRKHGNPPYRIAFLHGGPGVLKEMGWLAERFSSKHGILEPLESEITIDAQVAVFKMLFDEQASCPITLLGYSWGAWLAMIMASRFPDKVNKVILVSSGGFRESDGKDTLNTRLARLSEVKKEEAYSLMEILGGTKAGDRDEALPRLGELFSSLDNFNPMEDNSGEVEVRADIYEGLNKESMDLRKTGKLLEIASKVKCPVVAIHGDYDPHPADGVRGPLGAVLKDFRFILLEKCGHKPWIEKEAREKFFEVLDYELMI